MNDRSLHAVALALLLAIGFAGATTTGAAVTAEPHSTDPGVHVVEQSTVSQVNETDAGVSVLDALRMAENETNGTAIALEHEDVNGISAYDVTVLAANGTYTEVLVDASEPRILTVRSAEDGGEFEEDDGGFFDGLFGDDDQETVNVTNVDLRSATDAVTIASNATFGPEAVPANATVTAVDLHRIEGAYVYSVELEGTDGEEFDVLVDATPGPVLSVEADD